MKLRITITSHKHYGVSNHLILNCLFNSLAMLTRKTWKFYITKIRRLTDSSHEGPVIKIGSPWHDVIIVSDKTTVHNDTFSLHFVTSQWRHHERDGVSNYLRLQCLLNCRFRCRSKKTTKLRVTGLCLGDSPGTGEFPTQKVSKAENVSIWWRHHELVHVCVSWWRQSWLGLDNFTNKIYQTDTAQIICICSSINIQISFQ